MKKIITIESYRFGEFNRKNKDGGESVGHYARIWGRVSTGRMWAVVLWDSEAVSLNRQLEDVTPTGASIENMNFVVEVHGEIKQKLVSNNKASSEKSEPALVRQSYFQVEKNGFQLLMGPAQELHWTRVSAAIADKAAEKSAEHGDFKKAYETLHNCISKLTNDIDLKMSEKKEALGNSNKEDERPQPAKFASGQ